MNSEIKAYNEHLSDVQKEIAALVCKEIEHHIAQAESKVWHGHPVWFIEGNPIVGYSTSKEGIQLLFWSGQSFEEKGLQPSGSFKAAQAHYASVKDIDIKKLTSWLEESIKIQWDYKNILKRKGVLERIV